jgi:hypothetical protein
MARKPGDVNYSSREKTLIAKLAAKDAALEAMKAKLEVERAQKRELREKLGGK